MYYDDARGLVFDVNAARRIISKLIGRGTHEKMDDRELARSFLDLVGQMTTDPRTNLVRTRIR